MKIGTIIPYPLPSLQMSEKIVILHIFVFKFELIHGFQFLNCDKEKFQHTSGQQKLTQSFKHLTSFS